MVEDIKTRAQLWLCSEIVDQLTGAGHWATQAVHVPELAVAAEVDLGIGREAAEAVLRVIFMRWTILGFAQSTSFDGAFMLTTAGITFAHQQVILHRLEMIREVIPGLLW